MDVIIDFNVFISDYWMQTSDFRIVKNYLQKTDSKILLPSIILNEVKGNYERQLSSQIAKLESTLE